MSFLAATLTTALTALVVDALFGWPDALYRRIGHPVTWLGRLISALDRRWNQGDNRRRKGLIASLVTIFAAVLPAVLLTLLLAPLPGGAVLLGILAWPLVASRSLYDHVAAVARPLEAEDSAGARQAVAMIVGRDLDDRPEPIARAALESLAENESDGVIAPLFWAALLGLPGIAAYKAINTLDSMIGHLNPRYGDFGRFAAKLDDIVNLPASRLSGVLIAVAAPSLRAFAVMRRDARRHRSPNAGWPETAMAGALGVRLSGPRSYGGRESSEPWLNENARDPGPADLRRGLQIYRRSVVLMGLLLAASLAAVL
ncbi:adenosylcobinamide-phosphate synthase CbiB [Paracoccus aminophilus]|uniref:Cobalamin biosynthesis protein CobD n=1 Tax=Paracoccus aminophilus JCM 7686 TaxID=1367847 RepID=S5YW20_PARAH|nr:adenosylcobinamide-phosphate synthase CbiB [Paracoccus aminophilus]AGT09436.1 adenosylcobinamide-phosphate synthase CobD [Paracoccus aminophilus JCM 7686]